MTAPEVKGDGSTATRRRRPSGPAYDWRDHPESGPCPPCDQCPSRARWALARPEGWDELHRDFHWIFRAYACGRHLHSVLNEFDWQLDALKVYDLAQIPEGGC